MQDQLYNQSHTQFRNSKFQTKLNFSLTYFSINKMNTDIFTKKRVTIKEYRPCNKAIQKQKNIGKWVLKIAMYNEGKLKNM